MTHFPFELWISRTWQFSLNKEKNGNWPLVELLSFIWPWILTESRWWWEISHRSWLPYCPVCQNRYIHPRLLSLILQALRGNYEFQNCNYLLIFPLTIGLITEISRGKSIVGRLELWNKNRSGDVYKIAQFSRFSRMASLIFGLISSTY